jgi:hypothetical protein
MEWVKVYAANDEVQAELVNATLHAAGIETRVLDKKDSAYVMIGEVHIYVEEGNLEKARKLLIEDERFDDDKL